jgi:Protein of unknown function (DUF3175)
MTKTEKNRWSHRVMETSDALDREPSVFTWKQPRRIAQSLKRSALASSRRKAGPFQSAMSMLNFHINRGGKGIPPAQKRVLEQAKIELRKLFGRAEE